MLELRQSTGSRADSSDDDKGVALVVVLVVMLVGFVIVATVAASVMFTFTANNGNQIRTQAFIAAESGRDQMLAQYLASCKLSIPDSTTAPMYKNVSVVSSGSDAAHQSSPATCASATQTSVFVISATGQGKDGTVDTVKSTYMRPVTNTNQPGGTTSAQFGTFQSTKLSYTGDFVVRGGDYSCTQGATITGNLWVLKDTTKSPAVGGNVDLGAGCQVTGSIYAQGSVSLSGQGLSVGGNVISVGTSESVTAKKGSVGGGIFADGTIDFSSTTTASYLAGGAVTGGSGSGANAATSAANCAPVPGAKCMVNGTLTSTPGTAMYIPTPATVWNLTTWVDLDTTSNWTGTTANVLWYKPTGSCKSDWSSVLTQTLAAPYTRVGVDLSACANSAAVTITSPAATQTNDVVFVLPAAKSMSVTITGNLNSGLSVANAQNWPQIFLIHSDSKVATPPGPDCGSGANGDYVNLPSVVQSRIMIYSPCGLAPGITNGNGKLSFYGQYYTVADDKNDAQPEVNCQPMTWAPILSMGCQIAPSNSNGGGGSNPVPQPPTLLSQTEQ